MTVCRPLIVLVASAALAAPALADAGSVRGVAHPGNWPRAQSRGLVSSDAEAVVGKLMANMTLEEKVGQMIQADIASITPEDLRKYPLGSILAGGSSPPLGAPDRSGPQPWIDSARAFRAVSLEKRPGHTPIPILFGVDAVHGDNNVVGAVLFPHNIGLGAARDPQLIRRIGEVTAKETAAAGIDWAFGPTLAAPQDDRWGRTYEGYSEDPQLVASYAGQMVLGLQGPPGVKRPLQQGHVAASPKHFLGDGGTRNGVDQGNTDVSERELMSVHGQGYPPAIEAGAMTVMASFSSWQGVKMHGNASLLTGVLKARMGFQGFVVGDWNGHAQVPGCTATSCAAAANAGLDMYMAPDSWKGLYESTLAQARSGEIPAARIDDAVRRILRVKVRLGLFEPERPFAGRPGVIGAPEHRALAREAVRKSLVLLKNDGVLPLKSSARVLVAGSAADDIGRQAGGWTLSWQGTENKNSDFPNGQSIYGGIAEALKAGGGTAELSIDGRFTRQPDVAIVVFGETPYAEGVGDLKTLEYQPDAKADLALLRRLRAAGVPVVSVFLSGRPLWVNPEINASDAFVAAWLPGSEGGGVADVLIGDPAGRPRRDFHGRLSFSWPKTAGQFALNRGAPGYDPLFPFGYGLTYRHGGSVASLSEDPVLKLEARDTRTYLAGGKIPAPWTLTTSGGVTARPVDAGGVQESGRQLIFAGEGSAHAAFAGPATDFSFEANADMSLLVQYRMEEPPAAHVSLSFGGAALDVTPLISAPPGQWRELKIRLACFRNAGANIGAATEPFRLSTPGRLTLSLQTVRLTTDPAGAVCPGKAQ